MLAHKLKPVSIETHWPMRKVFTKAHETGKSYLDEKKKKKKGATEAFVKAAACRCSSK